MTDTNHKIRENRLRRAAHRQGLRLCKSRQRDPNGLTHGTYMLIESRTNAITHANFALEHGYGLTLDDVEKYLNRPGR